MKIQQKGDVNTGFSDILDKFDPDTDEEIVADEQQSGDAEVRDSEGAAKASNKKLKINMAADVEHVLAFRQSLHNLQQQKMNWTDRSFSRPFLLRERELPCAVPNATQRVHDAVSYVRRVYDEIPIHVADMRTFRSSNSSPHGSSDPVFSADGTAHDLFPDFSPAYKLLEEAAALDPQCLTPRLNILILQIGESCQDIDLTLYRSDLKALWGAQYASFAKLEKDLPEQTAQNAKFWFWRGISHELYTGHAGELYISRALKLDPLLRKEHIHPDKTATPEVLGSFRAAGEHEFQPEFYLRKALASLLAYYEYMPYFGGYPNVTYNGAVEFLHIWRYEAMPGLPPYPLAVLQRAYQWVFDRGNVRTPREVGESGPGGESWDVINTWLTIRFLQTSDRLAGVQMKPTNGYTAFYEHPNFLGPHTDRSFCEILFATLVFAYPSADYCPLYIMDKPLHKIGADGKWKGHFENASVQELMEDPDVVNVKRQVGMLHVLRGRSITHWITTTMEHAKCITILSCQVPANMSTEDQWVGHEAEGVAERH